MIDTKLPYDILNELNKYGVKSNSSIKILEDRLVYSLLSAEGYWQPTFEELVFACGYGFKELRYHTSGYWTAKSGPRTHNIVTRGATPKIVVARLLIKLKERKLI